MQQAVTEPQAEDGTATTEPSLTNTSEPEPPKQEEAKPAAEVPTYDQQFPSLGGQVPFVITVHYTPYTGRYRGAPRARPSPLLSAGGTPSPVFNLPP